MAEYKVPQDVEADDKLLGPFTFRQLIYLFISGGLIALSVGLFNIFPLLIVIPLPFIIFLIVLALPLKKDQPMETYLAAVISFRLKPNKRLWNPGQRESTILITAPKIVEKVRTKNISEEEASHRLSFLANIADSEGYAINDSNLNDNYVAEANSVPDIFDSIQSEKIEQNLADETSSRHDETINQMRNAIEQAENPSDAPHEIHKYSDHYQYKPEERNATDLPQTSDNNPIEENSASSVIVQPDLPETPDNQPPTPPSSPTDFISSETTEEIKESIEESKKEDSEKTEEKTVDPTLFKLAKEKTPFTVATIAGLAKENEDAKSVADLSSGEVTIKLK